MRGMLPAACVFAVLMTAGTSAALVGAVGIVAQTVSQTGDVVLAPTGTTVADVYDLAMEPPVAICAMEPVPQMCEVSVLVNAAVGSAIFLKNEAEAAAGGAADAMASDPVTGIGYTGETLRTKGELARSMAYERAETAWGAAWNLYYTAYAVAALELAAVGYVPTVADCTSAAPDALTFQACLVAWSNALLEL